MKKKIFLTGKVYDLASTSTQDIQTDVQNRLDAHYGKGCCIFRISADGNEVIINFFRSYNDYYHPEHKTNIFCADMDLLTGRGIEGFAVPYMWPTVPLGCPFSTGIDDFIPCYKKSAKKLGASRMKDIMISHNKISLNVRLFY